jgi:hypothetical protein
MGEIDLPDLVARTRAILDLIAEHDEPPESRWTIERPGLASVP